jgi:translation initiation factor IF-3
LRKNNNQRRPAPTGPRLNGRIRITPVRVSLEDGTQLGVISTNDAIAKAQELGLDLVEVNANVRPPICKIIDHGKFLYDEKKRRNEAKKKQSKVQIKQVKLRPKTDTHDIQFKAKNARRFLEDGNKVQFEVRFRGRENAHPQTGRDVLDKIMLELVDIAKLERAARYENKVMTMMVGPK